MPTPNTTSITSIAARSQPQCCGTCANWGLMKTHAKRGQPREVPGCYVHQEPIPPDQTTGYCAQWRREGREFAAVQLFFELGGVV